MRCRTITGTVTTVRVLEILGDHQLDPYHNPLDAHLFSDRPLRIQFCKLLTHQCQVSYLPSTGKHKYKHTHTHTISRQSSADGIKKKHYSERSLSRQCILNRYFKLPLSPHSKSIKKNILILTSEMTLKEATVARFV